MSNKEEAFSVPCSLKQVRVVKQRLIEFIGEDIYDEEQVFNLQLVLDEAVINAIDHGSANNLDLSVDIKFRLNHDRLSIYIKDYGGKAFNPDFFEKIASKKSWGRGGRGIFLIKDFMDEVNYVFDPNKSTMLFMAKELVKSVD